MSELSQKGTKEYSLADVLSRPNAMNGLYRKLNFPLGWEELKRKDAFYITHMADLADRVIREAEQTGKDLNDHKVQKELQASFYGGASGASLRIGIQKFIRLLGFGK